MRICIYDKNSTKQDLLYMGYGEVDYIHSCKVVEKENDDYYAELEVRKDSKKANYLKKMNILNIDYNYFRIINIDSTTKSGIIKLHAKHISFDSDLDLIFSKNFKDEPIENIFKNIIPQLYSNIIELEIIKDNMKECKLSISFETATFSEIVKILFEEYKKHTGQELQIRRINHRIQIGQNIGADTNIRFDSFKLDDVNETEDNNDYCTRLIPVGVFGDSKLYLNERYVIANGYNQLEYYDKHITKVVEFSEIGDVETLRKKGQEEVDKRFKGIKNIKIELSKIINSEAYSKLKYYQNINVGDYIDVDINGFGEFQKYKIIEKEYDHIGECIYTLGDKLESSLVNSLGISSQIKEAIKDNGFSLKYSKNDDIFIIDNSLKKICKYLINVGANNSLAIYVSIFVNNTIENNILFDIRCNGQSYSFFPKQKLGIGEEIVHFSIPLIDLIPNMANLVEVYVQSEKPIETEKQKINTIILGNIVGNGEQQTSPDTVILDKIDLTQSNMTMWDDIKIEFFVEGE